jgi:hypothetical protein
MVFRATAAVEDLYLSRVQQAGRSVGCGAECLVQKVEAKCFFLGGDYRAGEEWEGRAFS